MSERPVSIEVGDVIIHLFPDTVNVDDDFNVNVMYNVSNSKGDIIEDHDEELVRNIIQSYFEEAINNVKVE